MADSQQPERRITPAEIRLDEKGELDEVCSGTAHLERMDYDHWFLCIGDVAVWLYATRDGRLTVSHERRDPGKWCMRPEPPGPPPCEKCGQPVGPPTNRYMAANVVMGYKVWHGWCAPSNFECATVGSSKNG